MDIIRVKDDKRSSEGPIYQINVRSMRDFLQQLVKMGHCYMTKGTPRRQIPNTYHTNRINSVHGGFVTFGYNDLNTYLSELCEQGDVPAVTQN